MDIKKVVAQMTLEEKAGLCSGQDFWHLKAVQRLAVEAVMVSDGPHGLRKQDLEADHLGINESIAAVCFPSACGTAASFNREMLQRMGAALGEECQAEGVGVLLGPAINIKRSPLCGRNFEYMSEDPYLSGELASAYTDGVQSKNVGVSVKHYAANNQEDRRMSVSAEIDERTLREIYLSAFETVVKKSCPWTIMCSYNQINGEYVSQSKKLLNDILREEWGFDGYVMTDWGATDDRVAGLVAGQDLEMPGSGGVNDSEIVHAVQSGSLDVAVLDRAVARILTISQRFLEQRDASAVFDRERDHRLAREIACESMVLLKNESLLPLDPKQQIAFIGKFAKEPRYQGGGSSHINAHKVVSALEAVKDIANVTYAQGYNTHEDKVDAAMLAQAVAAAHAADVAVVFAGLPDSFESEGFDRTHMCIPGCQQQLIEAVAQANPNTVVVLHNGSPIEMPWLGQVKAVLESYLGGQAVGEAQVDLLFGRVNPSAKLAETFPMQLADNPAYLNFPGMGDTVEYREGVFVGYRWYDSVNREVLFPFGHGLSYTQYAYSNLEISQTELSGSETLRVSCNVKNIGSIAGKEIVQLYLRAKGSDVIRPDKELKGFAKVALLPNEETEISFELDRRAFAYYNTGDKDWCVSAGVYEVLVGASSRDIRLVAQVQQRQAVRKGWRVSRNSTVGDVMAHPATAPVLAVALQKLGMLSRPKEDTQKLGEATDAMQAAMLKNAPLRAARNFAKGKVDNAMLRNIVEALNAALVEFDAKQ